MTEFEAIDLAIRKAGSQASLSRAIGTTQQTVWKMLNNARRASADFVLKIEAATGISRHDLRPDLYPRDLPPAPQSPAPVSPAPDSAVTIPADRAPAASSSALSLPQGDEAGGGRGSERHDAGHGDGSLAPGAAVR